MRLIKDVLHIIDDQQGAKGPVNCVRLSKSGEYFLSGGTDKVIRLYNTKRGLKLADFTGAGRVINSLAISDKNDLFISGGDDRVVTAWDVNMQKILKRFSGHYERITSVCMSPDSHVLVSGSHDSTVRFWDIRGDQKKSLQTFIEAKDTISNVILFEYQLITSSFDGHLRSYDLRLGKVIEDNLYEAITSSTVSNDRNCFLASGKDGIVRLVDRESGDLLNHFSGHSNSNYRVEATFDSTDTHAISGSEDGKIYFWDLIEGNLVQTIKQHSKAVLTLDYSKEGQEEMLVSGGADGKIVVWN